MNKATLITLALVASFVCSALASCQVSVSSQRRDTSWQDSGRTFYIYDVSVTNTGSCQVTDVMLTISPDVAASVTFTQVWNLQQMGPTSFKLTNFGPSIFPGQVYGAGFIISFASPSQGVVATSLQSAACGASDCTAATTTGGSTTTGGTTTGGSTTGGLAEPRPVALPLAGGNGVCSVSASLSARSSANAGNWTDEAGRRNQIYDITVQNTGTCIVSTVRLAFALSDASSFISQRWNLDENYNVNTYGPIPVNGGFGGAGIVVTGNGTPTVSVADKTCDCSNVQ
jgi:hypothetical protein